MSSISEKHLGEKASSNLNSFYLLDNFSIKKRKSLIDDAEQITILISRGLDSPEHTAHLIGLQVKLLDLSKGGWLSNFCLKMISKANNVKELNYRSSLLKLDMKKIQKLLTADVPANKIPIFLGGKDLAKNLNKLIFDDHLYERMKAFNHNITFNDSGEITFKFSERTSIDDEIPEDTLDEIDSPDDYWCELYQDLLNKELSLCIKGEFEDGCYHIYALSEINHEQLKEMIVKEDGTFNKSIQLIHPRKELTLDELEECGILGKDEETGEYFIDCEYQYLENGFTSYFYEDWKFLKPFAYASIPPKDFTIDIIVHSSPGLPGVFSDQGHASVKITTPRGEIYSIGLMPEIAERDPYNLSLQRGKLLSPDPYIFMPSTSFERHTMSYTLTDPKAFHRLMNWIEALQSHQEDEETGEIKSCNLFYHPTHQSCASFASTLRHYALKLGAKSQKLKDRKISNWTKWSICIQEALLNFCVTNFLGKKKLLWDQGIDCAETKNFNITHLNPKGLYLPVDLILDHQLLC
ncbi:MAG: hypothetical protein H0W50_06205 [Parachlamydiaceae bacterium]|nr:hypothetical protein [Parachlamydiaceae bacterium]